MESQGESMTIELKKNQVSYKFSLSVLYIEMYCLTNIQMFTIYTISCMEIFTI